MSKTSELKLLLTEVFLEAKLAAVAADPGPDGDGGTCNMDTPTIVLPGVKASIVEECAEACGIRASFYTKYGKRNYWLWVPMNGQANRRSLMMQAAQKVLSDRIGDIEKLVPGAYTFGYYRAD